MLGLHRTHLLLAKPKSAPNRFAYCASKAAVIGLTKSIATDYSAQGIRCNAICSAAVNTPSLHQRVSEQAAKSGQGFDSVHAAFVARQAMGRLGTTEEVAALVTYLASDEFSFTTGTAQIIDGGWSNWHPARAWARAMSATYHIVRDRSRHLLNRAVFTGTN